MEEKLINLVSGYQCIWMKSAKGYQDKQRKENAWKFISDQLDVPVDECIAKWKYLRTRFTKAVEEEKKQTRSGAGGAIRKRFPHMDVMKFLTEHVKKRRTWTSEQNRSPQATPDSLAELMNERPSQYFSNSISVDTTPISQNTSVFNSEEFLSQFIEDIDNPNKYVDCEYLDEDIAINTNESPPPLNPVLNRKETSPKLPKKDRTKQNTLIKKYKKKVPYETTATAIETLDSAMDVVQKAAEELSKKPMSVPAPPVHVHLPEPKVPEADSEDVSFGKTLVLMLNGLSPEVKYNFMRDTFNNLMLLKISQPKEQL